MKVKNINGTSQNICMCKSWLQHWRNYSGQQAKQCRVLAYLRTDNVGDHVQKDYCDDNS